MERVDDLVVEHLNFAYLDHHAQYCRPRLTPRRTRGLVAR
jgi:hypothetical protein